MSNQKTEIVCVPAVNAAIMNKNAEILLTRRSRTVREPGKWCLPGGHIEFGEFWSKAMAREIKEEVGLDVVSEELIGIYSDPSLTVTAEAIKEGHRAQFVVALFLVREFRGDVEPNDEVDAWDWFPMGKLPEPMLRSHPVRVHDAFSFKREVFVR